MNKLQDLEYEISENNDLFISALIETWLNNLHDNSIFDFCRNFQIYKSDHENCLHGGVMIFINSSISSIKFFSKSFQGYIEILGIKSFINKLPLYFIIIYRSPNSYLIDDECVNFLINQNFDNDIILVGDFNLPGLFGDTKKYYSSQYDL